VTSKVSMTLEGDGTVETIEWDATDMLAAMTPEEIEEFQAEGGFDLLLGTSGTSTANSRAKKTTDKGTNTKASFEGYVRPSVVAWLKERKAEEGTPIRGGKFWTAVAGATNVDDSGLVVICPKDKVDSIFIDYAKYVAVVGSGQYLATKPKGLDDVKKELTEIEVIAKLRRGRGDDTVLVVGMSIAEHFSTGNHVVQVCQEKLQDGIRGDPASNPFDRRAPRRLIHCDAIAVSSLTCDDAAEVESICLPDDIVVLAERRNNHEFVDGSFLGRAELLENPYTNAYREINGAADGFPGWNVDRYDKWLLVQHDDQYPRGPLPSIHDGNTLGVYYLPADPNRSMMGRAEVRPTLLEGQPAPDFVPIQENGVTYLAALDKDLSTGIFLDQRPQRAWLTRNCNSDTRVLNCFSHCGAFTVAAASAGASTVSLDLNKKFLDRIPPQLELNGIDFDDRHDTIFGDCFDWLARLAKRGEQFDIIILDPPSTSIGIKKKRWSVKNDMAELVALAAPMVKKGGLLWTTTNSATIHPIKFAKMCKKGLDDVGLLGAKLERVVPMPTDFLCVGPQPVKNLVWRLRSLLRAY
jgi:23S rRNA G2069 N7-methylase RlmK/C1962 C5-methylase RlmI